MIVMNDVRRRLPIGAEPLPGRGVHFRVWAPIRKKVAVALEAGPGAGQIVSLAAEDDGYFSGVAKTAGVGTLYRFVLDDDSTRYPDPASRFQPEGPHGASQVVDATSFSWSDDKWAGCGLEGQFIYEMHVGTLTPEGTWEAATRELPILAELGVTILEVMPVNDFPGKFGWGYDGVNLFAPTRLYGQPDEFRTFVNRAHSLGIGVILDVVYNHIGPDGNYLKLFSPDYFTERYKNDWGESLNFDGDNAGPCREFFIANAGYWIDEFHLDGLRLDATQSIHDASKEHILIAIGRKAREAARGKPIVLVAENEPQATKLVRPIEQQGFGLDMLWNDDYHHSATTVLTARNEAYYTDYLGHPQEFVSAAKWGYLYQGQRYKWQKARRGSPSMGLNPAAFVNFLQNHDQIANSGTGQRAHQLSSPGRFRAMAAYTILMPGTPMLFQGDEFAASSPFFYFADHHEVLAPLVRDGRAEFLKQFRSVALPEMQANLPSPEDPTTFERSKLNPAERETHRPVFLLHRDLIALRKNDPVIRAPKRGEFDGAVLAPEAFLLRYFGGAHGDRLLLVNLGRDLHLDPAPEPLLAPPEDCAWQTIWSSEDPHYGGLGTFPPESTDNWRLPGQATVLMISRPRPVEAGADARGH